MTTSLDFNEALLQFRVDNSLDTPAYVYDESVIEQKLENLQRLREKSGCKILFSLKAMSCSGLLDKIACSVDGFSASSVFESRLAREILGDTGTVHMTSPGISESGISGLARYCDYISYNSTSQWQRLRKYSKGINNGLRINPEISFGHDSRYDPCRQGSRLGAPLSRLPAFSENPSLYEGLNGLHVHNNFESTNYTELTGTIDSVRQLHSELFESMQWLNLGGGYLLEDRNGLDYLADWILETRQEFALDVFFEPGKAVVGKAGYLIASVTDLFDSGDSTIAVLDTSINHLPEVFEYQLRPKVIGDTPGGKCTYQLAGASCLSGDIFGVYSFDRQLDIGSRVIFANVGAYMMVKANMFNGINLPSVYSVDNENRVILHKRYDYKDYRNRL